MSSWNSNSRLGLAKSAVAASRPEIAESVGLYSLTELLAYRTGRATCRQGMVAQKLGQHKNAEFGNKPLALALHDVKRQIKAGPTSVYPPAQGRPAHPSEHARGGSNRVVPLASNSTRRFRQSSREFIQIHSRRKADMRASIKQFLGRPRRSARSDDRPVQPEQLLILASRKSKR